jgi:hypothetical protein
VDKQFARLRYGGRKSAKLVRCYWKEEKGAYRIEVELHPGILDENGVVDVQHITNAARAIYPKHFHFADMDWEKLRLYLAKRNSRNGPAIFEKALKRAKSLRRVTKYLRGEDVPNVHRFLKPLAINRKIEEALDRWARHFEKESLWVSTK